MYLVTKTFVSGPLKGLTITEKSRVGFAVGDTFKPCAGASAYRITACVAVRA